MDLDALGGVVLGRAHEDFLAAHLAAQVPRQRDAVVQRMALGGDHGDRTVGVERTQLFGAGLAGDAVAEDDVTTCVQSFRSSTEYSNAKSG